MLGLDDNVAFGLHVSDEQGYLFHIFVDYFDAYVGFEKYLFIFIDHFLSDVYGSVLLLFVTLSRVTWKTFISHSNVPIPS